jgi:AcrR family transcriptional regulator
MPRKYEMKRRAEREEETRRRIVEAAVALHETRGVVRTTISDIAAQAGVERATVYRHFPDERALVTACTGHFATLNPPPDPTPWSEIADPEKRVRTGLVEIYTYHRRTERMVDRATRDFTEAPILREVLAPVFAFWAHVRDVLTADWPVSEERRAVVVAGVGHAIVFSTWQSLVREQGLDEAQAVEAMVAMVRGLAAN